MGQVTNQPNIIFIKEPCSVELSGSKNRVFPPNVAEKNSASGISPSGDLAVDAISG